MTNCEHWGIQTCCQGWDPQASRVVCLLGENEQRRGDEDTSKHEYTQVDIPPQWKKETQWKLGGIKSKRKVTCGNKEKSRRRFNVNAGPENQLEDCLLTGSRPGISSNTMFFSFWSL